MEDVGVAGREIQDSRLLKTSCDGIRGLMDSGGGLGRVGWSPGTVVAREGVWPGMGRRTMGTRMLSLDRSDLLASINEINGIQEAHPVTL